jgi:hypothetical protein
LLTNGRQRNVYCLHDNSSTYNNDAGTSLAENGSTIQLYTVFEIVHTQYTRSVSLQQGWFGDILNFLPNKITS